MRRASKMAKNDCIHFSHGICGCSGKGETCDQLLEWCQKFPKGGAWYNPAYRTVSHSGKVISSSDGATLVTQIVTESALDKELE
jgi:hypothetical protein